MGHATHLGKDLGYQSGERRCAYPSLTGRLGLLQRSLESRDFRCFVPVWVFASGDLVIQIHFMLQKVDPP
jgi:hypothetical protein